MTHTLLCLVCFKLEWLRYQCHFLVSDVCFTVFLSNIRDITILLDKLFPYLLKITLSLLPLTPIPFIQYWCGHPNKETTDPVGVKSLLYSCRPCPKSVCRSFHRADWLVAWTVSQSLRSKLLPQFLYGLQRNLIDMNNVKCRCTWHIFHVI